MDTASEHARRRERPFTRLGAALFLAAVDSVLGSCADAPGEPRGPASAAELAGPGVVMEDVTVHHSRGGATSFVARAPRLELYEGWRRLAASDAGVWLPRAELRASAGGVSARTVEGALEAYGGVDLVATDGLHASSPALSVDRRRGDGGTLGSDAGVLLRRCGLSVRAAAAEVDLAEQHVTLEAVASTITPPGVADGVAKGLERRTGAGLR